jgi:hypothetical protein
MPQCPICNAAFWVGEPYCATCGNYLPHAEEEARFCPQCSIRLAPQQEICHKCKAAFPEIDRTSSPVSARGWSIPFKVCGLFIGTSVAIVALLVVFFFTRSLRPPQQAVTPPPQAPSKQSHAAPPIPTVETAPATPTAPNAQEPAVIPAPSTPSAPKVTMPRPSLPIYIVDVDGLALRDGPAMSAPQIATLNLDEEVELLETSGGWGKVRDVRRNIIGWSYMRYLTYSDG